MPPPPIRQIAPPPKVTYNNRKFAIRHWKSELFGHFPRIQNSTNQLENWFSPKKRHFPRKIGWLGVHIFLWNLGEFPRRIWCGGGGLQPPPHHMPLGNTPKFHKKIMNPNHPILRGKWRFFVAIVAFPPPPTPKKPPRPPPHQFQTKSWIFENRPKNPFSN